LSTGSRSCQHWVSNTSLKFQKLDRYINESSSGTYSGPVVGVFLIGFFLPKCNIKGVWTGFILSCVMVLWITIGSIIYKTPTKMLPFSADECDHDDLNFTSLTIKNDQKYFSSANLTTIDENVDDP
ncbi:hypothetical protein Avbf_15982, partial [Armadillidium vulgare]